MLNKWCVLLALFGLAAMASAALDLDAGTPIMVRAKRQQCRCVREGSGLQCSCQKPHASSASQLLVEESAQKMELANQLTYASQARCACLQIVFQGNPQYQCHCGDQNGNPLPAQTTTLPPMTTTTVATTTTTEPTTTTTTHAPIITEATTIPTVTQPAAQPGACQCIMIHISGPASAQYQCSCQTTPAPPLLSSGQDLYPPVAMANGTSPGCFCVEQQGVNPSCGCQCDCTLHLCTVPQAVCVCPDESATPPPEVTVAPTTPVYMPAEPETPEPEIVTLAPITTPPPMLEPVTEPIVHTETHAPTYPLTTTCVMFAVQQPTCMCMPEYEQCAQNICCLRAKYRSYKNQPAHAPQNDASHSTNTIDMLMNVLEKIKQRIH